MDLVNGCCLIESEALVRAASVAAIEQEPGLQDVLETLTSLDLRPTRQRVALVRLTYRTGNRHVTAATPYGETIRTGGKVTVETVCNTLNQLIGADLLRPVTIDGAKTCLDTSVSNHRHFDLERTRELIDIPIIQTSLQDLQTLPAGDEVSRIDTAVRLRRAG